MESDHRDHRCHRPSAFDKMEGLMREMQDTDHGGVPVRSQKLFLTSIPSAFMGYDMIEWLMERLEIEESEALNIANQLCQYGYFFPISDSKNLAVKDDSSLYRFQSPYYWPWQNRPPDNVEYAIYLAKRTLRNKQRHGLEEYELEALSNLKKNLANKWDFITMQAEEQIKLAKVLKKGDKIVSDSQERAYWRVHRPPPGVVAPLEQCPVPTRSWNGSRTRRRTIEDCRREVELLKNSLSRTRVKVSQALESMIQHVQTYHDYDPLTNAQLPPNPWVSEDTTYWQLNSPLMDCPPTSRVKRWAISMEELVSDPTGLREFTQYLKKEYSHENIRFWRAVNDLRRSAQSQIPRMVEAIFKEFLAPAAPCEINIDGKTMEKIHQEMKNPTRFTFDAAQEHVYTLLLKKDCYPRFIRSEYYKTLLANGNYPIQKKRFFGFGPTKKKTSTSTAPLPQLVQQSGGTAQGGSGAGSSVCAGASSLTKRRGSDRSLSGSAHELAVAGVKDPKVPHSHSQSNLSDIPYRGDLANLPSNSGPSMAATEPSPVKKPSIAIVAGASTSEDVCPWESGPQQQHEPRSRKNSTQLDSGSSSSDISVAVADVTERVQRTSILTQQHTLDGGGLCTGRSLTAKSAEPVRRASVSVPIQHSGADGTRRKVSSFEDNSSAATSTSSSVFTLPAETAPQEGTSGKKGEVDESADKTVTKSHSLAKTCSVAPIISVSSVADDLPSEDSTAETEIPIVAPTAEPEEVTEATEATEPSEEVSAPSQEPEADLALPEPLAPLAVPDSESPASEAPPSELGEATGGQEGADAEAKSNDVCPWEDEETCKVDTPFVKTYATLGYL
ncbi:regulator of G-protein signaling 11 isoform X2 [Aethina tumida]|uniref:regulator of G-protein signaling 11 isoform X2 n=1 Tax=Aethina tumida TaxID=116153 RepID=UPI00214852F0|nr:regulator of G-protein signaling 11 isoform X2 [Aethina tumida]